MATKNSRPRWARKLSTQQWNHLKVGQAKDVPTLRDLKLDAATCCDCASVLRAVSA